jgi:tetratricopeptide (TPR) repeat protein
MQMNDWKFKENEPAKNALTQARALQQEVIDFCREEQADRLDTERLLSAEIAFQMGKFTEEREGTIDKAVSFYNECLQKDSEHKEALVSLARLYQHFGKNKDQCTQFCNRLLKIDPANEQATFMFANMMLMDDKTEEAIDTYIQLLEKEPANFSTLS